MVDMRDCLPPHTLAALVDGEIDVEEDRLRHIISCRRCFHILCEAIEVTSRERDGDPPGVD